MKKIILSGLVLSGVLFADTIVSADSLPQNAKDFISTHFKDSKINLVEKDWDGYEVKLSNGTEIDFKSNGDFKEIDGNYKAIPDTILPDILAKAKQSQNGAKLMEIEKKWNGYELKFDNNMEVYIDEKGEIKGQKLDD